MSCSSPIRCIPYICTEIFIFCNSINNRIVCCHSKHILTVYVKEGLPFAQDLSLENSDDFYVFGVLYFILCLNSFSSIDHRLRLYARFLILLILS